MRAASAARARHRAPNSREFAAHFSFLRLAIAKLRKIS
jgi:hypothetical protein